MYKKTAMLVLGFILIISLMAACGNNGNQESAKENTSNTGNTATPAANKTEKPAATPEAQKTEPPVENVDKTPVTLRISVGWNLSEEDFQQIFVKPVKEKYPWITLTHETLSQSTEKLTELIASGDKPDLFITGDSALPRFPDLGLAEDMNELIKKNNFDLSQLQPGVLSTIQAYAQKDETFAIPYSIGYQALYYNKDLFDNFGVPYPTDGMTWDEVLTLAKTMTRKDGDIQIHGLDQRDVTDIASPLSLNFFDPATGKAAIDTDEWKKAYEVFQASISIPGNAPENKKILSFNDFLTGKTVAMLTFGGLFHRMADAVEAGLNWDVVTYPVFPEKPDVYGQTNGYYLVINPMGTHKEQAFQVIAAALSESAQIASSEAGNVVTPLKSKAVQEVYAKNSEVLKGKNVQAIFKHHSADTRSNLTPNDNIAISAIKAHSYEIYDGKDINTIIRETVEDINAKVAAQEGK